MTSSSDNTDQINFIILAQSRDCLTEEFNLLMRELTPEAKRQALLKWKQIREQGINSEI